MSDLPWLWAVFTVIAAAGQTARNAMQRELTATLLARLNEHDIVDELRVIVSDEQRTTASFTFSSQMRPSTHEFRIYGPRNGLVLDQDHETLIRLRGGRFKSYLERFVPPCLPHRRRRGQDTRCLATRGPELRPCRDLVNSCHNLSCFILTMRR